MMTTTNTTSTISEEQLDRCHRVIDESTGQVFYKVESESDPLTEYTVRHIQVDGRWQLTCSCPAGQEGRNCKHRRWAQAHNAWYKSQAQVLEVVDRFPLPKSTTVVYTLSDGAEVVRYGDGATTCSCRIFQEETGPEHMTPHHCKHLEVVSSHLQEHMAELADYLRHVVTGR